MNKPKRRTYIKRYGYEHTERYIQALETYSKKLEKALDKAIEELQDAHFTSLYNMVIPYKEKEQWKEWLLEND